MAHTNWRNMLTRAMRERGESLDCVESSTMSEADMDVMFDSGYGGSEGCAFTVWTEHSVYFPVVYDGAEWVEGVSRHPDGKPTAHVGGQ